MHIKATEGGDKTSQYSYLVVNLSNWVRNNWVYQLPIMSKFREWGSIGLLRLGTANKLPQLFHALFGYSGQPKSVKEAGPIRISPDELAALLCKAGLKLFLQGHSEGKRGRRKRCQLRFVHCCAHCSCCEAYHLFNRVWALLVEFLMVPRWGLQADTRALFFPCKPWTFRDALQTLTAGMSMCLKLQHSALEISWCANAHTDWICTTRGEKLVAIVLRALLVQAILGSGLTRTRAAPISTSEARGLWIWEVFPGSLSNQLLVLKTWFLSRRDWQPVRT